MLTIGMSHYTIPLDIQHIFTICPTPSLLIIYLYRYIDLDLPINLLFKYHLLFIIFYFEVTRRYELIVIIYHCSPQDIFTWHKRGSNMGPVGRPW